MSTTNESATTRETRAFQLLRTVFVIAPIAFGLDKFANFLKRKAARRMGRRAPMSLRQRLSTVGEVVLDGLLSGVVAVAVVAVVGAAALALTVVLLGWWF